MGTLYILAVIVILLLIAIYRSGKKEDGFVRRFSRGAFLRDLNKKMEGNKP